MPPPLPPPPLVVVEVPRFEDVGPVPVLVLLPGFENVGPVPVPVLLPEFDVVGPVPVPVLLPEFEDFSPVPVPVPLPEPLWEPLPLPVPPVLVDLLLGLPLVPEGPVVVGPVLGGIALVPDVDVMEEDCVLDEPPVLDVFDTVVEDIRPPEPEEVVVVEPGERCPDPEPLRVEDVMICAELFPLPVMMVTVVI